MTDCNHDCANCSTECNSKNNAPTFENPHELSKIKKVIGIVSGKGGVGKSLATGLLATIMQRRGNKTAILDADITGPSVPKMFGLTEKATADQLGIYPVTTKTGIEVMSMNLLLENDTDPVVWRGPVIAGAVKQFWTDVVWNDVDYMFVDMPPGTGDVTLTVFQSIKLDGIIILTSPQELVSMIVEKAVNMAKLMNIPVIGIIENMAYFKCPDNGKRYNIFGDKNIKDVAAKFGIDNYAEIPINPDFAKICDQGLIELFEGDFLEDFCNKL